MTAKHRLQLFLVCIFALFPVLAGAATIEFRTLIDVDNNASTGCAVGGMTGVEHVVVTVVETDATTGKVDRSYRLVCAGNSLGSPVDVIEADWGIGYNPASGGMLVENRISFSAFGGAMPSRIRLGFDATTGASSHSASVTPNGSPIIYPDPPGRRRSVASGGNATRFFQLDGNGADWGNIEPVLNGIADSGTPAIRMIKAYAYANTSDQFLYFRVDANAGSQAPFAEDDEYDRPLNESLTVPAPGVLANDGDPNGQPLTALPVSPAAHGDVTLNADGSFTYAPNDPASSQTDTFQYKATNGSQESNVAKVTIKVSTIANRAPIAQDDSANTDEDQPLNVPAPGVLANDSDPDGDSITATKLTDPSNGSVVVNADGSFTYTPNPDFFGTDSFTYTVTAGESSATATVTITIASVNDTPVVSPASFFVDENSPNGTVVGSVSFSDADTADTHTFAITGGNTGGAFAINATTGLITVADSGALNAETVPSFNLTVTVTDSGSLSGSATITITLNDLNEAPTAVNDATTIAEDGNVNVPAPGLLANDSNPEGSSLTASKVSDPANGTATVAANGGWTYTPNPNFFGTDSFTYQISDGSQTSTATVTITVTAVNDVPSFTAGPATITHLADAGPYSQAWATNISPGPANESGQAVDFIVSNDNNALFTVQPAISPTGVLTFTPVGTLTGSATVSVQIHDNGGTANGGVNTSSVVTFVIEVDKIPVITSANNTTFTVGQNGSFTVTVSARPPADIMQSGTLPANVTFVNDPSPASSDGLLSGTPAAGTGGTYPITFTATNVHGSSAPQNFTLTVNEAPTVATNPSSQTVCAPANATFTASAGFGFPAPTVQWQVSTDGGLNFSNIAGANSNTYTFATAPSDNGKQYRAVFSNSTGTATTTAATLTVNTAPAVTTNPTNASVCENTLATFTAAASGSPAPTVQWQVSTDGGLNFSDVAGATNPSYSFTAVAADNGKQYRAVFTNSCSTATTTAATLTVTTPPAVTTNPVNSTVCEGATASFTAAASGSASTVQWQVSTDGGLNFGDIAGATNPTYSFTAATADNGRQYRAVFTNACGTATTTAATLTVNTAPAVTTNPTSTTVCENTLATFTAASSGSPAPTVQWQVSTDGGLNFSDIGGATNTTYSFTAVAADNAKQYRAVFTNSCSTATTSAATLTVTTPPTVTTNPTNFTACDGGLATFTAAASGSASTVQWQVSTDGGLNFSDIGGATNPTYTFNAFAADNGEQYRAVFTNSCGTATTTAATLTVNTPPAVTTNPNNSTVCEGAMATFTAAASGSPAPTVQWQLSTDGGLNFSDIGGATNTTYSFTTVAADNGKQYRAVFTNSCGTAATTAATLTVDTAPAVTTNPSNSTVCDGALATFTAAASGSPAPTVQWQVSTDGGLNFSDIGGATNTTYSFTAIAADSGKQYRAVFTNVCSTATTTAATLTVDTPPSVTTNPNNSTVCEGTLATFTAATSSPAPVQWQVSTDGGSNFSDIGGATNTTYSFTAAAADNGNQYRAVFTNSCGTATTTAATLTVNTSPAVTTNPSDSTLCEGAMATFTVAASGSPAPTVQWQVSTDGGLNFSDIGGETNTTYSFTTAAADNGKQYRAVFTNSCSTATTTAATLTVNTTPSVTANPGNSTVCDNTLATFTAAASGSPTPTVQWQVSIDGGLNFSDIGGATNTTYSFTAVTADNGKQYRAVFTNTCSTATTTAATLTVDVPPAVTTNPNDSTICEGVMATFTAAATGSPSPTVQWQVSTDGGLNFSDIGGATNTTYSFTTVAADNGRQYRAVFTNSCGTATTTAATLTVNTDPAVTTNPSDSTVCENTLATFTVAASGSPAPTVQWQVSTDGGSNFSDISGETNTTYSFTAIAADNTKQYRAVFTNSCGAATTTAATLTVNTPPAVTTHPLTQSVQSGDAATFTAASSGSPTPTVQWQVSTDGGLNFSDIGGATNTTYSFNTVLADNGKQYRAVFTNACGTATTNAATLTVTCPAITVERNGGGTFPNGTFNVAYSGESVTASGGTGPYTFQITAGALPTNLSLATDGTISGTPNVTGVFNFTVTATDAASCQGSQALTLSIGAAVTGESYNNVGNTNLIGFNFPAPGTPHVSNAQSLLANDSGPGLTVAVVTDAATTQGGKITTQADGSFSYTPAPNFTGTDTYIYTVMSNGVGSQATVQFVMAGKAWYVKNDHGSAGTGVSNDPFQALASAETASAAGDTIYVMTGDGTTANQNAGITLKANQILQGAGEAVLTVGAITITTPGAGTKPLIGHTAGSAVTLANGNTLKGFTAMTTTGAGLHGITGNALTTGPTISNVNVGPTTAAGLNITASGTISTPLTNVAISGAGTVGINMNDFGTLIINSGVTVAGVQALNLVGANNATGSTVNGTFGIVTATGGTNGIYLESLDGTITIPAGSSLSGASSAAFAIAGHTPGINVTYQGNITSSAGTAISVSASTGIHTGSLTFDTGTLNVTGGTGINIITASGTGNFYTTTGTATITGAATGVSLGVNSNGAYTFGQAATPASFTINDTTSTSFIISNTAADVIYNGNMSQTANAQTLLSFTSHNASGFATFQNGTLTASTGAGIAMADADGPVTFSGVVTLSGAAGVVIRQGSGGTINFSNTSSSITSTGTPFTVRGDAGGGNSPAVNGAITYSGTINKTSTGVLLDINTLSGSLVFNGSQLTGATADLAGVVVTVANITGTLTANHLSLDSSNTNFGPATLLTINGANSGTMTFHHLVLSANGTSARGTGILASGGGTLTITNTGGNSTITTRDAAALNITGMALGTSTINSVIVAGGANTVNAIALTTVTGTLNINGGSIAGATGPTFLVSGGTVSVTNAGTVTQANAAAAVSVTGNHTTGTLTFNGNVTATNGTGLQFSNADGTYNFNGTNLLNGAGDEGIDILLGSTGTFSFSSNTSITNPSGIAFNMSASAPTSMTYSGTISHNAGRAVEINGDTDPGVGVTVGGCGDSTTFSGNITNSGASATGLQVTNCNAGTITFSGASKSLSTAGNTAVTLTTNTGATVMFTNGGLAITRTTGSGVIASGGGTLIITGPANTIGSGSGTAALSVNGLTIGTGGLVFQSISQNGGSNGIFLQNTGSTAGLTVTGNSSGNCGGDADTNTGDVRVWSTVAPVTADCTGGTIQNTSGGDNTTGGSGIYLNNTQRVSLTRVKLNDHSNYAIQITSVTGFTADNLYITGTNGTNGTFDEGGIWISNLAGTSGAGTNASISNSTIEGAFEHNVWMVNDSAVLNRITFDNVTVNANAVATGDKGIAVEVTGTSSTSVTVDNCRFTSARGDMFNLTVQGASGLADLIIDNTEFNNVHSNIVGGGGGVLVNVGESGDLTYSITNNLFRGAKGVGLGVQKLHGGAPSNGTASGTINNNHIGVTGVVGSGSSEASGIIITILGSGSHTSSVTNNQIRGYHNYGIYLFVGGSSEGTTGVTHNGVYHVTITGNNIAEPTNTWTFPQYGIHLRGGTNSGDEYPMCVDISGNTLDNSGGTVGASTGEDLFLWPRFDVITRLPGYGGSATDNAAVVTYIKNRNNNSVATSVLALEQSVAGWSGGAACNQP